MRQYKLDAVQVSIFNEEVVVNVVQQDLVVNFKQVGDGDDEEPSGEDNPS